MAPELSLEVIYYKQKTDFKLEFALCSACSVRFLSTLTHSLQEFTAALQRALSRSRAVVVVGSFQPQSADYLPRLLAETLGLQLQGVDVAHFGITDSQQPQLPQDGLPLVTVTGRCGGCVLERADQALILLTDEIALRQELAQDLVCPYLAYFAERKVGKGQKKQQSAAQQAPAPGGAQKPDRAEPPAANLAKSAANRDAQPNSAPAAAVANGAGEPKSAGLAKAEEIIHSALKAADDIVAAVHAGKSPALKTGTPNSANSGPANHLSASPVPPQPPQAKNAGENRPSPALQGEGAALSTPREPAKKQPYGNPELNLLANPQAPVTADSILPLEGQEPEAAPLQESGYSVLEQPDCLGDNAYDALVGEEGPHRSRRKVVRAIISVILVLCVILAAYFGYEYVYQPVHCSAVYNGVREMYGQTWNELPENMLVKFGKLYSTNQDISGWLSVPECDINYPVVTTVNKSASYYNTHLFEGSVSEYGTPYMNQTTDAESFYRNLVIYGKSFEDGQMFSKLRNYLNLEVYRKAPVISFDTVYLESKWKVIAVFETAQENTAAYCQSVFFDDDAFALYLEKIRNASVIETGIEVTAQDELLTLTSQQNGKSIVVVGRKVRDGESPLVDVTESHVRDYQKSEGKTVQAAATPSLKEESAASSRPADSSVDKSMADGASSRYEQKGPAASQPPVAVKPTKPVSSASASSSASRPGSSAAGSSVSSAASSGTAPAVKLPNITVTNQNTGQKVSGNAADILAQVIEAEMGSGYHIEALKAQTVAAYSWLICNGALRGGAPAVPMKPAGERARQAVKEVAGTVAVYGGNVAQTYYYAISAGYTANCQDVWVASLPYLVSVDSSVDKNISGYQTVRSYKAADVAKWVKETAGVDLTALSDKTQWFRCSYDAHGLYVKTVTIGGKLSKKGPYLREQIFTSARVGSANVLRSSAYTITYNKAEDKFIFTVRGYGHGIGMSQVGANAYAKSGWSYEQILKHYYKGITLGVYTQ